MTPTTLIRIDAVTCGAMAVLLLAGFGPLADRLDIPGALSLTVGIALIPWVAFLAWLGRENPPDPRLYRLVVVGNVAWVAGSAIALFTVDANGWGMAFIGIQALAVTGLATLQELALRSPETVAA